MKLKILVGTMTDTALRVAQAIQLDAADLVHDIEVLKMDALRINVFDDQDGDPLYLICTSTYGSGDVPDNAHNLYDSLDTEPQFLGHVQYGVMALGDQTYPQTFCFGGKKFDARLQDLGAQRRGEVWCHDASTSDQPEADGVTWCRQWLAHVLLAARASPESSPA